MNNNNIEQQTEKIVCFLKDKYPDADGFAITRDDAGNITRLQALFGVVPYTTTPEIKDQSTHETNASDGHIEWRGNTELILKQWLEYIK
jgi:hypothetical protein